jgi:hypothetical protein
MLTERGLLIFYGIPAFVFGIMLFIEKAQQDDATTISTGRGPLSGRYRLNDR